MTTKVKNTNNLQHGGDCSTCVKNNGRNCDFCAYETMHTKPENGYYYIKALINKQYTTIPEHEHMNWEVKEGETYVAAVDIYDGGKDIIFASILNPTRPYNGYGTITLKGWCTEPEFVLLSKVPTYTDFANLNLLSPA